MQINADTVNRFVERHGQFCFLNMHLLILQTQESAVVFFEQMQGHSYGEWIIH